MSFVPTSFLSSISTANRELADAQEYGVVKIDDEGNVLLYNKYESELAGLPPEEAEGRNFFTQVAPCSNNRLFFGRFKEGLAGGELNEEFKYTFTYKMKPTPVDVHLFRDAATETNWIFVKRAA